MWRSTYSSNSQLIEGLVKCGVIKSKVVAETMAKIDRKNYTPYNPYDDCPQTIGFGATISAPHMHAYALEHLQHQLKTAKAVLDVGSGTGYLTVAMALMAPPNCKVYGIEHVPELVQSSIKNIQKGNSQLLKGKVVLKAGDGRLGWQEGSKEFKFDAIHVGAAAAIVPEALLNQLNEGGRMLIPVGGQSDIQEFVALDRVKGQIIKTFINSVCYVPLTSLKSQLKSFG